MKDLFNNLLISSPNGGGLFFLHNETVLRLDDFGTTGLHAKGDKCLRAIQPAELVIYDEATSEITQTHFPFHDIHDVCIDGEYLYMVATSGNEIIRLSAKGRELERSVFKGEKDSLHINCIARWNDEIVFSAFGDFSKHREYKGKTSGAAFVQRLSGGAPVITGLSQPHSLVPLGANLLLANSETMEIMLYSPSGALLRAKRMDGYTRGICVRDNRIYVGLSRSRNISNSGIKSATVIALDMDSWDELGRATLPTAEIYAMQPMNHPEILEKIIAHSARKIASVDWKITLPLREARRWRNAPMLQIHRYIGLAS